MTGWVIHVTRPSKDGPVASTTSLITSQEELEASLKAFRDWPVMGLLRVAGVSRVTLRRSA
ncbi:hypothetical protein EAH89_17210 [Roseomonas nepalensis]|uniref:Uncharacterized protein n=1 Tax=Muricoccus nepalensis TaxID=1854500 RepID=A0A502FUG6_9PROT|nr:hypothetical protein [Roseomonas nepalensis]TPG53257.1 hypothetical protein EAH89_17210 [Roseomonas nepalensis]